MTDTLAEVIRELEQGLDIFDRALDDNARYVAREILQRHTRPANIRLLLDALRDAEAKVAKYRTALEEISAETSTDLIGDEWLTSAAVLARRTLGPSQ